MQDSASFQTMYQRSFLPCNLDAQGSNLSRFLLIRPRKESSRFAGTKDSKYQMMVLRQFLSCARVTCVVWLTCYNRCPWSTINQRFQVKESTNLQVIHPLNSWRPLSTPCWIKTSTNATSGLETNSKLWVSLLKRLWGNFISWCFLEQCQANRNHSL